MLMDNLWKADESKEVRQEREERWALELEAYRVLAMPTSEAQAYLEKHERTGTPELRKKVREIYKQQRGL